MGSLSFSRRSGGRRAVGRRGGLADLAGPRAVRRLALAAGLVGLPLGLSLWPGPGGRTGTPDGPGRRRRRRRRDPYPGELPGPAHDPGRGHGGLRVPSFHTVCSTTAGPSYRYRPRSGRWRLRFGPGFFPAGPRGKRHLRWHRADQPRGAPARPAGRVAYRVTFTRPGSTARLLPAPGHALGDHRRSRRLPDRDAAQATARGQATGALLGRARGERRACARPTPGDPRRQTAGLGDALASARCCSSTATWWWSGATRWSGPTPTPSSPHVTSPPGPPRRPRRPAPAGAAGGPRQAS